MTENQWKQYYEGMILRGGMKKEKEREMVANCGGQKWTMKQDPTDPLKELEVLEPYEEAVDRIKREVQELTSRESLEQKADQIIVELRRR